MHHYHSKNEKNENENRPGGIFTVTIEEKDMYMIIKDRLKNLLEYQITNFR
mgnify:CR=1 FL=1